MPKDVIADQLRDITDKLQGLIEQKKKVLSEEKELKEELWKKERGLGKLINSSGIEKINDKLDAVNRDLDILQKAINDLAQAAHKIKQTPAPTQTVSATPYGSMPSSAAAAAIKPAGIPPGPPTVPTNYASMPQATPGQHVDPAPVEPTVSKPEKSQYNSILRATPRNQPLRKGIKRWFRPLKKQQVQLWDNCRLDEIQQN